MKRAVAKISGILIFVLSSSFGYCQKPVKVVNKQAILFYSYDPLSEVVLKDSLEAPRRRVERDSLGREIVRFSQKIDRPVDVHGFIPNLGQNYLGRFFYFLRRDWPFYYHYSDIFIAPGVDTLSAKSVVQDIGLDWNTYKKSYRLIDVNQLEKSNENLLKYNNEGIIGKFWKISGEWEVYHTKEKPEFIKATSHVMSYSDNYTIYVLKSISRIDPLDDVVGMENIRNFRIRWW